MGKPQEELFDLSSLVSWDQRQRVRALSINKTQLKGMPNIGISMRARYKDANKAAMEVAISRRPNSQEQELRDQDRKYNRIAPLAAQRIKYLFVTPDHFFHEQKTAGKENRQKTRELKKALFLEISVTGTEEGHRWQPKGNGLQCTQCQCRVHQHLTLAQLRQAKEEKCALATGLSVKGGEPPAESKQAYIQKLIDNPAPDGHELQIQTNYLVCNKCGLRTLRNSAREKIEQLHQTRCWSGPWEPPVTWTGNPSHKLHRRGNKVIMVH